MVQYEDGNHIDFTVWPVELVNELANSGRLPDDLDMGYKILLDKDRLTARLPSPTYSARIPARPDAAAFAKTVEDFFSDVPYVAKCLCRNDLLPAKWCLDCDMKHNFLRQMLEWYAETKHDWGIPINAMGRGLKKILPGEIWQRLEKTYVGLNVDDNWIALFETIKLFRDVGTDVGAWLGYSYPLEMDLKVVQLAQEMRGSVLTQLPPSDVES